MSLFKKFIGKSKGDRHEVHTDKMAYKKPESESQETGTVLRQPEAATPLTKRKVSTEYTALEMAERQGWDVKTLSVWEPGDVILDTYEVEDVISGGMGHVYIANHKSWNVKLAIKSPNEMMLSNKSNFARILREADSWTELGLHPNIAYCYCVRNIEEVPHIFVEYVGGGNLRQWIEEGRCIDYRTSLDLAIQFCHGMEHAHSKGMIHRDIKPENVLITEDGVLKITDFGLVRVEAAVSVSPAFDDGGTQQPQGTGLTTVGTLMGTEGYMAPEQAESARDVDERADIFAFGICLYEMFCGNRPYKVTFGPKQPSPDPVSLSGDEDFSSDIATVLTKAVQWDPSERFKSFDEIRQAFCHIYRDLFGEESPYAELELLDLGADGLNNRGVAYFDIGRKNDAIDCWEKALEINKLHPEATYNLNLFLWRNAKITDDEVLRRLETCKKNPLVEPEMLSELKALIHAERMDFDAAKDALEKSPAKYDSLFPGNNFDRIENLQTLEGHMDHISAVAISPDDRFVASGSGDKTVRVWELASGECVHTLEGHTELVSSVAISPNGKYVVSGSGDTTIRIWELSSGKCAHSLEGHSKFVSSVAISADSRYLVTASGDKTVRVWELASGVNVHSLEGHKGGVRSIAISPDSRYVVSGSDDKTVRVWDLISGRCVNSLKGHTHAIFPVAISPDGKYVLSGSGDKTLQIWELSSGRHHKILEGHMLWVQTAVFSPDGRYVVSGSGDKTMRVWEFSSGQCLHTLEGYTSPIHSVAISPDSRYAVSGGSDKTIRMWQLASGRCLRTLEGHTDQARSVVFSSDGNYAASGSWDKTVRVWKIISNKSYMAEHRVSLPKGFKERKKEEDALKISILNAEQLYKKGKYYQSFSMMYRILKGSDFEKNKQLNLLNSDLKKKGRIKGIKKSFQNKLRKGREIVGGFSVISPNGAGLNCLAFSRDLKYCVRILGYSSIKVDNRTGNREHNLKGHTEKVNSVAFSPDGDYLVSGSSDNSIRVWRLANGRCVQTLKGHTSWVQSVAFSPAGKFIISGSSDKTVQIWELASGRSVRTLKGHSYGVNSVAVSPDGSYVVSGSDDRTIRVWEFESGLCVHKLEGHNDRVKSVAISLDGQYVVSGSDDTTVRIWELASGSLIQTLEGHTDKVESVCFSPNGQFVVSGSWDKTVRWWELIWDLGFPDPVDWDEGVRPYLEIFLILKDGKWTEEDFHALIKELAEKRGYGWVRPEGIRKELEKMSKN